MAGLEQLALQRMVIPGDIEIHYAQAGEGPPLVFVHGGMGDWTSWAPQWEAFTARFRCFTYSRRYSSPNRNQINSTGHSVLAEAQDLASLLEGWEAEPAVLVGTSYGAYTALQVALAWPQKVRALALTEPPVLPFADRVAGGREARVRFEREVLRPSDAAFSAGQAEEAVRMLTLGINGSGAGEASTPAGRERRLRNAEAMRALALSSNAYPALDEAAMQALRVPTLLLHGDRTLDVHRATTAAVAQLMPQAQTMQIADSGHGVHRDNPAQFNRSVMAFLARELNLHASELS
ncbi:MAG TPA: alpha/beta hydrolase [Burkholderiaceae bacterium]|nr:alpha/beta hydrolase [Burkholderiaceae bacterium]